tara:strand:- start:377 stop:511 length:135 start_codon:yes stop_codon:yes gene_type:complete
MNKLKNKLRILWMNIREPYDRYRIRRKNKKKIEKQSPKKHYIYE